MQLLILNLNLKSRVNIFFLKMKHERCKKSNFKVEICPYLCATSKEKLKINIFKSFLMPI
jgi:hypothetical protein